MPAVRDRVHRSFVKGETDKTLLSLAETNFSRHLHNYALRLLDAVELRVEGQASAFTEVLRPLQVRIQSAWRRESARMRSSTCTS